MVFKNPVKDECFENYCKDPKRNAPWARLGRILDAPGQQLSYTQPLSYVYDDSDADKMSPWFSLMTLTPHDATVPRSRIREKHNCLITVTPSSQFIMDVSIGLSYGR